ncbi:MAG: ribonuclease H-like domain-containing protein [Desulfobulbaceae bacterium]|jgi:uncharacterized protein YprB with RNaseH-like and TPR domain|nr:ribonuclease H-like domain-containing protein [Desulfobulbaceae bacterium]
MLRHTFRHLPGIGPAAERRLWRQGILSWDDWRDGRPRSLAAVYRPQAEELLARSRLALSAGEARFFAKLLKPPECWRLFPDFRQQSAYLDIETSGLGADAELSLLTLYDGYVATRYVNGENLADFAPDVARYAVLISFNGRRFDIPFLERALHIRLPQAQIDLCPVLRSLGYRGGLKKVEEALGIARGDLRGVDGLAAVYLWRRYRESGDRRFLETLSAYNFADTVNLERLMFIACRMKLAATPFADEFAEAFATPPPAPENPWRVWPECLPYYEK